MRGMKAKALRSLVEKTCSELPGVKYVLENVRKQDGTSRSIIQLDKACKRRVYQRLKRNLKLGIDSTDVLAFA